MEEHKANQKSSKTMILSVHDGAVQDVFCTDPDLRVILVDWDSEESDSDAPGLVEVRTAANHPEHAYVADFAISSLSDLLGTDVLCALQAANTVPPECQSVEPPEEVLTDSVQWHPFSLNLDGPQFRDQRTLLLKLLARTERLVPPTSSPDEKELLEGLINLTDAIADQARDRYGVDCQIDKTDQPCECDLCQRYPSDDAALEKLQELGLGRP